MSEPMHDLAAAYALDALDDLERARFEHHVGTCGECAEEVAQMADTAAAWAATIAVAPPAAMRSRVLAAIDSVPQEGAAPLSVIEEVPTVRRPVWSWVAVAAVLAVALLSWTALRSTDPVDAVLTAADAVRTAAVATDDGAGRFATATVVHSSDLGQAVLIVDGLTDVGDDRTYEAWVIDATSTSPAGLFVPDDDGTARIEIEGTVGPGVTVAVTEEAAGGVDTPQGAVLFAAEVDA